MIKGHARRAAQARGSTGLHWSILHVRGSRPGLPEAQCALVVPFPSVVVVDVDECEGLTNRRGRGPAVAPRLSSLGRALGAVVGTQRGGIPMFHVKQLNSDPRHALMASRHNSTAAIGRSRFVALRAVPQNAGRRPVNRRARGRTFHVKHRRCAMLPYCRAKAPPSVFSVGDVPQG